MKIGYLGPEGTFSQQAVLLYQKNIKKGELVQYSNIYGALEAVIKGEIEECVVPFENSIEGTVTSTIDLLIFTPELYIKGEMIVPVLEDFLVRQDYAGEPITKILSHPQALSQCAGFLRKHFPNASLHPTNSTAEAAKMVAQSTEPIASLSPRQSARVYGLKALFEGVQDDEQNKTRFIVVNPHGYNYCRYTGILTTAEGKRVLKQLKGEVKENKFEVLEGTTEATEEQNNVQRVNNIYSEVEALENRLKLVKSNKLKYKLQDQINRKMKEIAKIILSDELLYLQFMKESKE